MPVEKRQSPANVKKTQKKNSKKTQKKLSDREQVIFEIKRKLVAQKEQLLHEAETALNTLPDEEAFPDMGDQASADTDKNFMLKLRGREQKLLKKIELALEQIDSLNYGICEVCGNEIETKRLKVRPVATMCIECKTDQEEEEKRIES